MDTAGRVTMVRAEPSERRASATERTRVTVKDIARDLNVSIATVSRAFKDDSTIAKSTRTRVLARANEMGYSPNLFARGLITQRSRIAALMSSNITNPFYPEVVMKLTQRLHKFGLQTMLFTSNGEGVVDDGLPLLQQYSPDIVIVLAASLSSKTVENCVEGNTPVILFNRYASGSPASVICCDNEGGGRLVANRLAQAGHKRLAYISGYDDASTNIDRMRGFLEGCQEAGMETPRLITGGDFTYEAGYRGMKALLDDAKAPEAVFCGNDLLAIGAMDSARREFGKRVPDDISVIGFDDIAMSSWPSHDLTTVAQPVNAMIDRLICEVERLLSTEDHSARQYFMPGELIIRNSARLAADPNR